MSRHSVRKPITILLAIVLFGLTSVYTASSETVGTTSDGLIYSIMDGTATITGYTGTATELNIPSLVGEVAVSSIGYAAFQGCEQLTSVSLPATLTGIGDWAFNNCDKLQSLVLPSGLQSIGNYAFYNCHSLTAMSVPAGVTSIGDYAFIQSGLQSISIPSSVSSLDGSCFYGCRSLAAINVYPSGPVNFKSSDGVLFDGSMTNLLAYPWSKPGPSYVIPSTITRIGTKAFAHDAQAKLGDLIVPDSVTSCADDAFLDGSSIILHLNNNPYMTQYAEKKNITWILDGGTVDGSGIKTVAEKVDWIVATYVKPGMSAFQKAVVLHDWLVGHVAYDTTYSKGTAYNALIQGLAICQGYSEAYRLLLNKVDIPNQFAYGPNHVWNVVQFGGKWYHVDVQGDDSSWDNHTFFGVTDEMRKSGNITYINSSVVCDSVEYNYEYRMGYFKEYFEGLKVKIQENLESGQLTCKFARSVEDWQIRSPHYQIVMYDLEKSSWFAGGIKYLASVQYDKEADSFTLSFKADPAGTDSLPLPGDATNDGTVDILDLVSIIDCIVSNTAPTSPTNADANGDGAVDILDLVWIIDEIVGG